MKEKISKTEDIIKMHESYVMSSYKPGLTFIKGRGSWLWDAEGKKYLDFIAGIGVTSIGHCHPQLTRSIQTQSRKLMHVSNLFYNENQPPLARFLSRKSLDGKCFFCNSGAEANEALIKLARRWGSKKNKFEIITFKNSFHGRTLATLTATGQDKVKEGYDPLPPGFQLAEFNSLDSVRKKINEHTVGILVEPVQGEGGINVASEEFMHGLRSLCNEFEILLLCDEIQCGLGRTGKWFAYQHYNIKPDALTLAKGLGGGFPIGALITGSELQNVFLPGTHGTTFGGNPLACAAALAVVQTIEKEKLVGKVEKKGMILLERLNKLREKYPFIHHVRGKGLMLGVVLDRPSKELEKILERKGLITITTSDKVLRLLPPLTVNNFEIRKATRIFKKGCAEWLNYIGDNKE